MNKLCASFSVSLLAAGQASALTPSRTVIPAFGLLGFGLVGTSQPARHGRFSSAVIALLLLLACLGSDHSFAQAALPAVTTTPAANGGTTYSLTLETMLFMTALTFIPAVVLLMTSFTRIIIVLSLLRSAMGTQTTPPSQILLALALFLSMFVMAPTLERVYQDAYKPFSENKINIMEAGERAAKPMKAFMLSQTRESDLALFLGVAKVDGLEKAEDTPMRVLIPAFVISELKTAFQIGFVVYIPFLIIDMVVASLLMSMGMMMMSPVMVALPFKIMLFVLVDGWHLIIAALVKSFSI